MASSSSMAMGKRAQSKMPKTMTLQHLMAKRMEKRSRQSMMLRFAIHQLMSPLVEMS